MALWKEIVAKAEALESKMAPELKDAYYQLVLYPTKASAGVAEIYLATGKNNLFAKQGRPSANDFAARAKELFDLDKDLSNRYNNEMAGGKWKNMMSDRHIGYTQWKMPKEDVLPELSTVKTLEEPALGVAVEGSEAAWPRMTKKLSLPTFDPLDDQTYYIDLFNQGIGEVDFTASVVQPWIKISQASGKFSKELRLDVKIDWSKAPKGKVEGGIDIASYKGDKVRVIVPVVNDKVPVSKEPFFGSLSNAEFSIPAYAYNNNIAGKDAKWVFIPDLGRDKGNMGIHPVTAPSATANTAARLEYKVYLPKPGKVTIALGILPVQDVNPARGLRIATGFDEQQPVIIDARQGFVDTFKEYTAKNLEISKVLKALPPKNKLALSSNGKRRRNEIFDNIRWLEVQMDVDKAGFHLFKVYMVDPEIVLEKIVVNPDNRRSSYFGAPAKQHTLKK